MALWLWESWASLVGRSGTVNRCCVCRVVISNVCEDDELQVDLSLDREPLSLTQERL